jgi:hypothetical protein
MQGAEPVDTSLYPKTAILARNSATSPAISRTAGCRSAW